MSIEILRDVPVPQRKARNSAIVDELIKTLQEMDSGASFVIEGKLKKNTVKRIAKKCNIKVKIDGDENGKLYCWKI